MTVTTWSTGPPFLTRGGSLGSWGVCDCLRLGFAGKGHTLKPRYKMVQDPLGDLPPFASGWKVGSPKRPVPSGSCCVLLTYQLDGSVTDMLW